MTCVVRAVVCMQMIHNRLFACRAEKPNKRWLAPKSRQDFTGVLVRRHRSRKFIEYTYVYLVYPSFRWDYGHTLFREVAGERRVCVP